jgi:hypothetical protein
MPKYVTANFAQSTLVADITAAATTLQVQAGHAALFPEPTANPNEQLVPLVLVKVATSQREVVYCTGRAGAVLTVRRAQEGTAALAFAAGDVVSVRVTKGQQQAFLQHPPTENLIDNAAFQVWQGGPGPFAIGAPAWSADRWAVYSSGAIAATAERYDFLGVGSVAGYGMKIQRTAGDASAENVSLVQNFTSATSRSLRGRYAIFTFKAQKGDDYSPAGSNMQAQIIMGTGTDEQVWAGFTGQAVLATVTPTLQSNLTDFATEPIFIPANCNQLAIILQTGTFQGVAGVADMVIFSETQVILVENGQTYGRAAVRNFADELARAEFFYQKSFNYDVAPAQAAGRDGMDTYAQLINGAGTIVYYVRFRRRMRPGAAPGITTYNPDVANDQMRNIAGNLDNAATTVTFPSESGFRVSATTNAGSTLGQSNGLHWTADRRL